jgi:hypothetical protein
LCDDHKTKADNDSDVTSRYHHAAIRHLPITNFIRNNHIVFELPGIRQRIELANQVEIVRQILEDGLEEVGFVAIEEELLFEADTVIANHFSCSLRSIFDDLLFF